MTEPIMRFLRDLSIKLKLTLLAVVTSSLALLLACAAFVAYEQINFRKVMVRDLSITARMIGENCAAALSFNDPRSAEQTLQTLRASPGIVGASIYTSEGTLFAQYDREGANPGFVPPVVRESGHKFGADDLGLFRGIDLASEDIGTVYIQSDLNELRARWARYALIVVTVFFGCSLAALLIAARLQRMISEPVLNLADIAGRVASNKNYSIRALKHGDDELGRLIDGFNNMLEQIQQQDRALQEANDRALQKANESLAHERDLLRALLDTVPDAIYFKDRESRFIRTSRFMEERFKAGLAGELAGKTDFDLYTEEHARVAFEDEQKIIRAGEPLIGKTEKETWLDGRVTWSLTSKLPLRNIHGETIGTLGVSKDITAIKETEARLEDAHKQLLDTSRKAGMAEVATSVLHNVGNVLNSVNTSASLIGDQLHKSKLTGVSRVAVLLEEHRHDLAGFLAENGRVDQVIGYLKSLAQQLTGEQEKILGEVKELAGNIEHIKEIVTMQQSYARVSGVTERVNVVDLVEDSIRMNTGALSRHGVQLVRDFAPMPPITIEKHKVLQILVNLIRNAKYACNESNRPDKRMTIQVSNGDDRVRIAVIDNGVGIPKENLTRIFNHGFTTREHGHGFGLHSGALAARELGGELKVHSDGPGQGARFTLELPMTFPEPPVNGNHSNHHFQATQQEHTT